jgi:TolB-like protein
MEKPQAVVGTPPPAAARRAPPLALLVGAGLAATLAAGGLVLLFTTPPKPPVAVGPPPPAAAPVAPPAVAPPALHGAPHTGPLRACIFPFKSVGEQGTGLGDALQEAVSTRLGTRSDVRLVERGSIDLDVGEMDFQAKYADPATRAALGRITGAEVALLGGYQRHKDVVRVFARFVDVESGEVLDSFQLDGKEARGEVFKLEEGVAARADRALPGLLERLRP